MQIMHLPTMPLPILCIILGARIALMKLVDTVENTFSSSPGSGVQVET